MWELNSGAFVNVVTPLGGPEEVATMLYFSLTTLTTTGYGDIVPVIHSPAAWPIWSRSSGNSFSPTQLPAS